MKKRVSAVLTISGIIILLGGLFTYGLGMHEILPVPRPDLVVWGTSLIGILMIVSGACDLLVKKTRQELIEEQDERNIMISRTAMAWTYQVLTFLMVIAIFALIFMGYMNHISCFVLIVAFLAGQAVLPISIWYLSRKL